MNHHYQVSIFVSYAQELFTNSGCDVLGSSGKLNIVIKSSTLEIGGALER